MSTDVPLSRLSPGTLVEGQTFVDEDISHLAGIEFFTCRFEGCRLADARLSKVVFERCEFVGCDLTKLLWGSSSLRGVRFVDCKLMGVNFAGAADNPEVSYDGCLMRYSVFDGVNLRGIHFNNCHLHDASFVECDLNDADFGGSDLEGAVLRNCRMAGADFSTATGLFFEPAQNRARDAYISPETAIQLARAAGLRVAGTDQPLSATTTKRKKR
jgi:fluoroquinolone resistance protein